MLSVFAIGLVNAAKSFTAAGTESTNTLAGAVQTGIDGIVDALSPVTSWIFGAEKSTGDAGFIALMAFLLTILVMVGILSPMKIFGDKEGINWAIAVIIALVGIRFVPINMLRSFTIPSEGLVGALFLIIPFIIVGTLISKISLAGVRKFSWIVYAVIIASLWVKAYNSTAGWTRFYWIYVIILVLCIVAFFLDGTIQKFFRMQKFQRDVTESASLELEIVEGKVKELEESLARAEDDAQRAKISKQLNKEKANYAALLKASGR
jgi:hypothetical protein